MDPRQRPNGGDPGEAGPGRKALPGEGRERFDVLWSSVPALRRAGESLEGQRPEDSGSRDASGEKSGGGVRG